jgi:cell division protein ZapA
MNKTNKEWCMNDKIKINLQIADANYPLQINMEEEELVRVAAKQVNMRLNTYRSHYKNLELEKIIAMVAYEFSLENQKLKQRNDTEPYSKKIDELTDLLEEYFRKE